MSELNWRDCLEVLYGTPVSDRLMNAWDYYLREIKTSNNEIVEAIEYAKERKVVVKFRATAGDVCEWVNDLRKKKSREGMAAMSHINHAQRFKDEWTCKLNDGWSAESMEEEAVFVQGLDEAGIKALIAEIKGEV